MNQRQYEMMRQKVLQSLQKPEQSVVFLYYPLVSFKGIFVILLNNGWTTDRERERERQSSGDWALLQHLFLVMLFLCSGVFSSLSLLWTKTVWSETKGFGLKKKVLSPRSTVITRIFHPTTTVWDILNVGNRLPFVLLIDDTTITWCFPPPSLVHVITNGNIS